MEKRLERRQEKLVVGEMNSKVNAKTGINLLIKTEGMSQVQAAYRFYNNENIDMHLYVKPELNKLLGETAKSLNNSNIKIKYLDASFPFMDKFPLLPHLSHNDGKKIDISFVYEESKEIVNEKKSRSGYGVFVPSQNNKPKKSAYELGEHLFGLADSGQTNLSTNYKTRLKEKLNEKYSLNR